MAQVDLAQIPEFLLGAFRQGDPGWESKTQEQANLALFSRILGLIAMGEYGEVEQYLGPEVSFLLVAPARFPWVRQAAGPREFVSALTHNFQAVQQQRAEILSLVGQGDTIMLMGHENGQQTDTGEPYEVLTAQQLTFEEGRLMRFRSVVGLLS